MRGRRKSIAIAEPVKAIFPCRPILPAVLNLREYHRRELERRRQFKRRRCRRVFNRWYNFIGLYYGGDGFSTSAEAGSVAGGYGQDSVFENIMLKNPSGGSFGGSAAINDQVKNITIWGPIARNGYGVSIGTAPVNVGTTGGQFTCINCFVMTANNGFLITPNTSVTGLSTWQLLNPATVNTVTPFSPTIGGSGGKIIGAVNGTGIVDTTTRTLMEQCPIQVGGTGNQLKGAGSASGKHRPTSARIFSTSMRTASRTPPRSSGTR